MRLNTPCCRSFSLLLGAALLAQLLTTCLACYLLQQHVSGDHVGRCIWAVGWVSAGGSLGLIVLFSLVFSRRRRAYRMLRSGLGAFVNGSFNVRLPEPRDEEFGRLARQVNQVVECMKKQASAEIAPETVAAPASRKIIEMPTAESGE